MVSLLQSGSVHGLARTTTDTPGYRSFNLVYVSDYVDAMIRNIVVDDGYLYLTENNDNVLSVWDVSDPTHPFQVSEVVIPGGLSLAKRGQYVYISGNQSNTVSVVDVSNPLAPAVIGIVGPDKRLGFAHGSDLYGDFFYVAAQSYGFTIVDISNPRAPIIRGSLSGAGELPRGIVSTHDVHVDTANPSIVYASSHSSHVMSIDVSDPDAPVVLDSVYLPVEFADINKVGDYVFSSGGGQGGAYGASSWMISFDVSNPKDITIAGELEGAYAYWQEPLDSWKGVKGSYLALTGTSALSILDISNPTDMIEVDSWDDEHLINNIRNVAVYGDYLYYTAHYLSGMRILVFGPDRAPPTRPQVNEWWDSRWRNRKTLAFNADAIHQDLVGFVIRVHLTGSNFSFSRAGANGEDVRFIDQDNSTELDFEIEKWDAAGQDAVLWAKVPRIDRHSRHTDYVFLYYNNPEAPAASDAAATWSDAVAVWHFSSNLLDSTGNYHAWAPDPGNVAISDAESVADWSGTDVALDGNDKQQGLYSLVDTVASPKPGVIYETTFDPPGTWSLGERDLWFQMKSTRGSADFASARVYLYDASGNWRSHALTFAAGVWTPSGYQVKVSRNGATSATPPDPSQIDYISFKFRAADETAFYTKIDWLHADGGPVFHEGKLVFDGLNDFVRIDGLNALPGLTGMSYLQWASLGAYPAGPTRELLTWIKWDDANGGVSASVGPVAGNQIRMLARPADGGTSALYKTYAPGMETMWGFTWNNAAGGFMSVMDSEIYGETPTLPARGLIRPRDALFIGSNRYTFGNAVFTISHTELYARSLTPAEIRAKNMNREDTLLRYGEEDSHWGAGASQGPDPTAPQTIAADTTAPRIPSPLSPPSASKITGLTPTLEWSDVTDHSGVSYSLEIDDTPDMSSPLLVKTALASSEYAVAPEEALPEGTYYWRVKATDGVGNEGGWSAGSAFQMESSQLPLVGIVLGCIALLAGAAIAAPAARRARQRRRAATA